MENEHIKSTILRMTQEMRSDICLADTGEEYTILLTSRRHLEDPAGWERQICHFLPLPLPSASGMILPGDAVRSDTLDD